ncbi:hypothetical protein QVD17_39854 [Tagetes erecta]|uniref:Transmembrane protein n=1 Tax=Tagetes erecta TaxID=13708 RepID=A0AAD8JPB1_TARER|nr:hypothetical protein QVD17_39854 [Tagetes erecta]
MVFNQDLRFLLLPLAYLLFSHNTSAIIVDVFLLFASIKVPVSLQLTTTSTILRFQAIDLSVSVTICFLCLIFLSTPHFWIANSFIIVCMAPWDDLLFQMIKIVFWWLYDSLRSINHVHEAVCIFNASHEDEEEEEEAHGVDQQEELNVDVNFVAIDVNHQQQEDQLNVELDVNDHHEELNVGDNFVSIDVDDQLELDQQEAL